MTDRDRPQAWLEFAVGRTNFNLSAVMLRNGKQVRAELYIRGQSAKQHLPENSDDWDRQHRWLAERLNDLHRVFSARVKALPDPDEE